MFENGIKIKIHDGSINTVDKSTQQAVERAADKINSTFAPEVFSDVTIHIASDYANLPSSGSSLNNYLKKNEKSLYAKLGTTIESLDGNNEVFIQESAFWPTKLKNLFSSKLSFSADDRIEHTTLHELGHQFNYKGADKKLRQEVQKISEKYNHDIVGRRLSPEENKIMFEYGKNNGFSDKQEFKDAILKDLKALKLTQEVMKKYYHELVEFYNNGSSLTPHAEYIENADSSRNEIFAQLFSYALGGEDDKKEDLIKMFSNTYNVIQNIINEHSKK